jgi:hypothetical protein
MNKILKGIIFLLAMTASIMAVGKLYDRNVINEWVSFAILFAEGWVVSYFLTKYFNG